MIHAEQEVKRCIQNCYVRKRCFRVDPVKQQMAPLPQFRVEIPKLRYDFGRPYYTIIWRWPRLSTLQASETCLQEWQQDELGPRCCGAPTGLISSLGIEFRELVAQLDQDQIRHSSPNKRNRMALESTSSTLFRRSLRSHDKGCKTSDLCYFKRRRCSDRGASNLLRWSGKFIEFQTTHDCQR